MVKSTGPTGVTVSGVRGRRTYDVGAMPFADEHCWRCLTGSQRVFRQLSIGLSVMSEARYRRAL